MMRPRPGDRVVRRVRSEVAAAGNAEPPGLESAGKRGRPPIMFAPDIRHTRGARLLRYGGTVAVLAVLTAAFVPVRETLGLLNMGLGFLMVVMGATIWAGRRAGLLAALLGFALFNFFLVPPYLTFVIGDPQNILALFVFLAVSLLVSRLIADAREQAHLAQRRAEDVSRLYELSQTIIGARRLEDVLPAIATKVRAVFEVQSCWILLPAPEQHLRVQAQAPAVGRGLTRDEEGLAEWAFWHEREAGQGGLTAAYGAGPNAGTAAAFVPLRAAGRTLGVLGVADKTNQRPLTTAERTVLATFADQTAVALERLTLLREAERAEVLARTDELKSALMSAVSHDLRTPLASIVASVTGLLELGLSLDEATRREFLQGIYEEAQRLNRLVGNLLDMSRIEGGALRPEQDWYNIREVIMAVVERLAPRLEGRPVTVEVPRDLPLLLLDFTEIDQVLTNLVENALKYTPPGTAITIAAHRQDQAIAVSVTDQGPGVPPEHLRYLFDKFYRVEGAGPQGRRPQGLGLGLAISKGLIAAHGGRITARNMSGEGLQVVFTLPIPPSPAAQEAPSGPLALAPTGC